MSMAIALDNSPQTISNLNNLKNLLTINKNLISSTDKLFINDIVVTPEMIDELSDWVDDMYKILTDFTFFSQENLVND